MAGAGSGSILFLSLRTGSDESVIPLGDGSNSIGDLNVPPTNGGGSNFIGELSDPPLSEIQKMMRELKQFRKEKQECEARRKRRLEMAKGSNGDFLGDEIESG